MRVADLRQMLVELSDDEEVAFVFTVGDDAYEFEAEVARTVEGDVEVRLTCDDFADDTKGLDGRERAVEEKEMEAERYATALRILEEDAGVDEHDLDWVANSVDPVGALARMRR